MFGFGKKKEERANVTFTQSEPASFAELVGLLPQGQKAVVTPQTALGVPAIWAAVNFISGTIAGLPLHIYERDGESRSRVVSPLARILHDNVSDEMTSFEWRKYTFERILTGGRGFTLIQRDRSGRIAGLFPLDPSNVTIERREGRKAYIYKENGRTFTYAASEVIDVPFMLREDGLRHLGPITTNKDVISLALSVQQYSTRFFDSGGVPPYAVSGNFMSGDALRRASDDLQDAVKRAAAEGRQVLTLPDGLKIDRLGADPEQSQTMELQKFIVEQIARIYNLPPTFLQDLSHGTFSNTEQQDLHFVKHTLKRWVEQFEQEMNLKLFGRNATKFVEFSMDGMLRGDFKTRMEGYATGIQNAMLTPNEVRQMENREPLQSGDDLMIQGATVPINSQNSMEGENDA